MHTNSRSSPKGKQKKKIRFSAPGFQNDRISATGRADRIHTHQYSAVSGNVGNEFYWQLSVNRTHKYTHLHNGAQQVNAHVRIMATVFNGNPVSRYADESNQQSADGKHRLRFIFKRYCGSRSCVVYEKGWRTVNRNVYRILTFNFFF